MMQSEFEALTMRKNATISCELYQIIERFYLSENDYHAANNPNGTYENKQNFCHRIFGGKVNTPHTILAKITAEAIRENNFMLENRQINQDELSRQAVMITIHYAACAKMLW